MTYEEQRTQHNKGRNKLSYEYISDGDPIPDPTVFRINASSLANHFDYTAQWYREKLLGEDSAFKASTGSVLGTIVHYLIEQLITNGSAKQNNVTEAMAYAALHASETVELDLIESNYLPMYKKVQWYLNDNPVAIAEPFIEYTMTPGITAGGSIDAIRILIGDFITVGHKQMQPNGEPFTDISQLSGMTVELIDWKTMSANTPIADTIENKELNTMLKKTLKYLGVDEIFGLSAPTSMPKNYEWQLLEYSYILQKKYGITVSTITDVFITRNQINRMGKPNKDGICKSIKDYPSTIGIVTKPVTAESIEFIESLLQIVTDSVSTFIKKPELRYLLASDYRLKNNATKLPFIVGIQPKIDI